MKLLLMILVACLMVSGCQNKKEYERGYSEGYFKGWKTGNGGSIAHLGHKRIDGKLTWVGIGNEDI